MSWLVENKEWFFPLAGLVLTVGGWFFAASRKKSSKKLVQRGGDGSINIQVAGNLTVDKEKK